MGLSDITKKAIKENRKLFQTDQPDWGLFFEMVAKQYRGAGQLPTIAYDLYMNREKLGIGNFLEQMSSLPDGMFAGSSLEEIDIPANIQEIGAACFAGCARLRECRIEPSAPIREIPRGCFTLCSSLKDVYLPDSIQDIGYLAFDGCPDTIKIHKKRTGKRIRAFSKDLQFLQRHFSEEV